MAQGTTARPPAGHEEARRQGLIAATPLLGGGRAAARALTVDERSWRAWVGGERGISDGVLTDTATALRQHAADCTARAALLLELIGAEGAEPTRPDAAPAPVDPGDVMRARFRALPRSVQLRMAKGLIDIDAAELEAPAAWEAEARARATETAALEAAAKEAI